mmetsp:Transcript_25201/g.51445  ORF Transcript_25201/g.51445 Transcript_25201/m.51445 type:complete len:102 (-) Transcript_25201:115-420(-)
MHLFAKIERVAAWTSYSIVTDVNDKNEPTFKPLYVAQKLPSMKSMQLVKTAGEEGVVVAKAAARKRGSRESDVEIGEGADMVAVLILLIATKPGSHAELFA